MNTPDRDCELNNINIPYNLLTSEKLSDFYTNQLSLQHTNLLQSGYDFLEIYDIIFFNDHYYTLNKWHIEDFVDFSFSLYPFYKVVNMSNKIL